MPEREHGNPVLPLQQEVDVVQLNRAMDVMKLGTTRVEYTDEKASKHVVIYKVGNTIRVDFHPLKEGK